MVPGAGVVTARAAAAVTFFLCLATHGPVAAEPVRAFRAARGQGVGAGQCWSPPQAAEGARCASIFAALARPFEAAPKVEAGLATPAGARHLLRAYFDERGWRVAGLEPQAWRAGGPRAAGARDLAALLPALAAAIFDERADAPGVALEDVAAFAAAVEGFLFEEALGSLEAVCKHFDVSAPLRQNAAQRVLMVALALREAPERLEDYRWEALERLVRRVPRAAERWDEAGDAVRGLLFARRHRASPFGGGGSFSLADLARLGPRVLEDRGGQRHADCGLMKEDLMARSRGGSGLVPVAKFWSQDDRTREVSFLYDETIEHLRAIGALDETSGRHPQVRIPNYVLAPLNCVAYSSAMTRCCLNECEFIMKDLENQVGAPMAAPEALIGVVSNLSTSSVDAPRRLPPGLAKRLHAIADERSGQVPLHGRVFAEWLHLAFPNECPFPHSVDDGALRTHGHWFAHGVIEEQLLSKEDKAKQQQLFNASEDELHAGLEDFGSRAWVDETLHFPVPRNSRGTLLAGPARAALLVAMGALLVRVARASVQEGACGARGPKSEFV